MDQIKAAIILFATLIMFIFPLLIRDYYRLKRHDRTAQRGTERAKAPE